MMARWNQLKKRGDWLIVEHTPIANVRSAIKLWMERNYSKYCVYKCVEVPEGVLVFLAFVPDGTVEEYDARFESTRQNRIDQINRLRDEGRLNPYNEHHREKIAKVHGDIPDRPGEYFPTDEELEEMNEEYENDEDD